MQEVEGEKYLRIASGWSFYCRQNIAGPRLDNLFIIPADLDLAGGRS